MMDKSPLNLLFYKPPTSAQDILLIVELAFRLICLLSARQTLSGVNMYPSYENTPENISQLYCPCWYLRFWNHHQSEDFPMKICGLTSMIQTILWKQDLSSMETMETTFGNLKRFYLTEAIKPKLSKLSTVAPYTLKMATESLTINATVILVTLVS